MSLTELPKAEKVFKEYVGTQIEQLIDQSDNLAQRYIHEREAIVEKSRSTRRSRLDV